MIVLGGGGAGKSKDMNFFKKSNVSFSTVSNESNYTKVKYNMTISFIRINNVLICNSQAESFVHYRIQIVDNYDLP